MMVKLAIDNILMSEETSIEKKIKAPCPSF